MRFSNALRLLVSITGAALAGCATSPRHPRGPSLPLAVPSGEAILAAGLSPARAQDGRRLYDTKCLRCHKSYDPHAYSEPMWNSWMAKMTRKAHLDIEQRDLLVRYLGAVRATPSVEKQ